MNIGDFFISSSLLFLIDFLFYPTIIIKKQNPTVMKTLLALLSFCPALFNLNAQPLIRWDFEVNGNSTLSPTYIGDGSLAVNPVAYSNFFPLQGMSIFTNGASGQLADRASRVRNWSLNSWDGDWLQNWIEFRFFNSASKVLVVDSISLWIKKNIPGPQVLHFRDHKDGYTTSIDSVLLQQSDTLWRKWVFPVNSFLVEGFQQVTFRIYGYDAISSTLGTLTTDSVAIFGSVSSAQPLHLRAFLAGPFADSTGLMNDDLRTQGLIPLEDPYGGSRSIADGALTVSDQNAIVDWVVVEIRNADNPSVVVRSIPALLQKDGDIVGTDGVSYPVTDSLPGGYHVSVRHRNHLGVMTNTPVLLSDTLDFTLTQTQVSGLDSRKQINSSMLLWEGDVNADNQIKYTGESNDRDPILQDVGGVNPNNNTGGYLDTDVNMDGVTKYTGQSNDRDVILLNIGGSVPTNVKYGSLP